MNVDVRHRPAITIKCGDFAVDVAGDPMRQQRVANKEDKCCENQYNKGCFFDAIIYRHLQCSMNGWKWLPRAKPMLVCYYQFIGRDKVPKNVGYFFDLFDER